MNRSTRQEEGKAALLLQRRVDEVCLRFERAWKAQQRPTIEEFLGDTPEPERSILRRELLVLEMAYRQRSGDSHAAEYTENLVPGGAESAPHTGLRKATEAAPLTAAPTGMAHEEAAPDQAAIPGYDLHGVLGRGGMGVVYKARQCALNRVVAVKMILSGAHARPEELARFRREAATIARLHHPHIVQIYEVGEHNGQPFCALEFVEGGSLARMLGGKPQPPRLTAQIVETLARAMHAAHQAGIIHRDLKPANVLVSADGTPKITDFGLAKHVDDDTWRTHSDVIMGTPAYMAPEQAAGKRRHIGPHTDVYSLGAILYEMLTGRPPFLAATGMELLVQVRLQEPVPPSRLQPKVPRDLETICLKCLEKDPQRRYVSALVLAEDLHHFLANEPILARPVRFWERGWKWAKRRPVAAALAAVTSLAVLSLVVAVFAIMQMRIVAARTLHEDELRHQKLLNLYEEAQGYVYAGRRPEAAAALERALEMVAEPSLVELKKSAESLLGEVKRIVKTLDQFRDLRDKAFFYGTLATGEDRQANLNKTKRAGLEALSLFGVTMDARGALDLKSRFTGNEKAEIYAGCYELLLTLAEAESLQGQPKQALLIMDRAHSLGWTVGHPTQAYHLRRARILELLGYESQAQKQRAQAATLHPNTALDCYLVGDEYYKQGKVREAVDAFNNALEKQYDHFWARYFLSVCYLSPQFSNPGLAELHLSICLNQRRDFIWLYLMRGFARTQLKKFQDADQDFRNAKSLLQLAPSPDAGHGLYANWGVLWFERGRNEKSEKKGLFFANAVRDLQNAIELKPREYLAYVSLAQVYQEQNKWDEAVKQLDKAIELESNQAFLYRLHGLIYVQRPDRNLDAALKDMEKAIAAEERAGNSKMLASYYAEKGHILYLRQKYDDAVTACNKAMGIDSKHANACFWRAEAYLKLRKPGNFQNAEASFDEYLNKGGRQFLFDVYRDRGFARAQCEKYFDAIIDYTSALQIKPEDPFVLEARGWAHLATQHYKGARSDFGHAIRLQPDNGDLYKGRGYARVKLGEIRIALADAEEAVRRGPKTSRLHYDVARIYAQAFAKVQADARQLKLALDYQHRTVQQLRQSLALLPAKEREQFWWNTVLSDSDLSPIYKSTEFLQLAREYPQRPK